ncbi:MAG: PrsW family intramembrane metalloprotease [Gemmatimonadales bacterium]|nr:PrsW family intramembrane metalloprotease [Gemmatimonadales bacterium]
MSDYGVLVRTAMALGPVLAFLAILNWSDSYKLVSPRRILTFLAAGGAMASLSYMINSSLLELTGLGNLAYAMGVAPLVEEALKATFVIWCLKRGKVGFLVDAAILGFATGAGFSLLENLYYLYQLPQAPLIVWIIRGLGTAVMHGGCTAIFAVLVLARTRGSRGALQRAWLPGLMVVVLLHAGFNRAMVQPVVTTLLMLLVLPGIFWFVYRRGEKNLRQWVGKGFDRDQELLALIKDGQVGETPLGRYLVSLRESFRADMVADMLCLLRLQAELSIAAKGALLLRQHGFQPGFGKGSTGELASELVAKLAEVRWLERSVGRAGLLALRPLNPGRDRDRWQREFLRAGSKIKGNEQAPHDAGPF